MNILSRSRSTSAVGGAVQIGRKRLDLPKATLIVAFLLLPGLIYFAFVLLPVLQAAQFSLFKWNGLGPMENFVGFDNYKQVFRDGIFMRALGNNLLLVAMSVLIQLPLALGLALLIRQRLPGRAIF